ncbi:outer membrane beta-barrel protein [Acidithiobacillus sp. AMEEHan]|uniref:outer membrane beta-barrel protein n=1 Tax=Acidithiobacillus sp. AMEEHan TaxID=2994951 RepID=UPI0027E44BD7|nr:outer membrane beta-barrel protein [Acidithiobacillus sp. AMEEHan]
MQGVAGAMGFWQDNPRDVAGTFGAKYAGATITNGSVIVQKSSGLLQFYAQAGVYSFPAVAASLTGANPTSTINDFGALPIAYVKIAPSSDFSMEIGKLPTLIGAESGFTYQNINIERGLLWDMEPIISRGIQFNASAGPLSASLSWNDGCYSNRCNVLSGLLTYTINSANTLAFYADGPLGKVRESAPNIAAYSAYGTASQIYGLMYTYSSGPWTIEPYFHYMITSKSTRLGINKSFDNYGGSLLVNYAVDSDISLAGRVEYLAVGGVPGEGLESIASSLTDLPDDSHAWSLTVIPTNNLATSLPVRNSLTLPPQHLRAPDLRARVVWPPVRCAAGWSRPAFFSDGNHKGVEV